MTKTDELISKLEKYINLLKIHTARYDLGNPNHKKLRSEIFQLKEQIKKEETLKEKIKPLISNEESVVSKWIREDREQWTTDRVINFVNWYLRLCKVITDKDCRFKLENQSVIDSFQNGDDYKLWWNKVNPDVIPDTSDLEYCFESFIRSNHLSREWEKHYEEWHNGEHIEQPLKSTEEILKNKLKEFNININIDKVFVRFKQAMIEAIQDYANQTIRDITDEEIEKEATNYANNYHYGIYSEKKDKAHKRGYTEGAKWMRSKMKR